ncbi:MAG: MOSC domain-containing protein [Vicinamibacterales bacterium]
MKILNVAVGRPQHIEWQGDLVLTSIVKTAVTHRVWVSRTNIQGDEQSDLTVHGGSGKAVYVYPSEHYSAWRHELSIDVLPWASFGENLTAVGLREDEVFIGDRYRIGSAEFIVTQPRLPCYKLALKFGRADIVRRFSKADRSGFYLAVEREGEIGVDDDVVLLERDTHALTVAEAYRLKLGGGSRTRLEVAATHPALPPGWRSAFQRRLDGDDA